MEAYCQAESPMLGQRAICQMESFTLDGESYIRWITAHQIGCCTSDKELHIRWGAAHQMALNEELYIR